MGIKDLLIGPIVAVVVLMLALVIRGRVTSPETRKYFIPGLFVKIVGAVAVGGIYYFYYGGLGDTVAYFDHGSKHFYEAFLESPSIWFRLLFSDGGYDPLTAKYVYQIWHHRDESSYLLIKIISVFDILTTHSYAGTAICFAGLSFTGVWALFSAFYKLYPRIHKRLAIAILFIPSVFFWGSGILKDSLTLAALGWFFYALVCLFTKQGKTLPMILLLLLGSFVLLWVKIYIFLCIAPAVMIWWVLRSVSRIRNTLMRKLAVPIYLIVAAVGAVLGLSQLGKVNQQYSIDRIAYTAQTTAWWIGYVSQTEGGAYYSLGDDDFSPMGMLKKSPRAIWVSLFRPYLWEVRSPIMLVSSLESMFFLLISLRLFFKYGLKRPLTVIRKTPVLVCALMFAIVFAFAVGVTTQNFGTLARYKIPLMPFYLASIFIIEYLIRKRKIERIAQKLRLLKQLSASKNT